MTGVDGDLRLATCCGVPLPQPLSATTVILLDEAGPPDGLTPVRPVRVFCNRSHLTSWLQKALVRIPGQRE